eukprot:gene10383-11497_t
MIKCSKRGQSFFAVGREQAEGSKFQEEIASAEKKPTNSAIKKGNVEEESKEEAKILDLGELQSRAAVVMKAKKGWITSTSLSPADLSCEIDGHMKGLRVINELIAQASVSEAKVAALPMQVSYDNKPLRKTKTIVDGDNGWYEDYLQFSLDRSRKIDYEEEETVQSQEQQTEGQVEETPDKGLPLKKARFSSSSSSSRSFEKKDAKAELFPSLSAAAVIEDLSR